MSDSRLERTLENCRRELASERERVRELEWTLEEVLRYFDGYGMPPAGFPLRLVLSALRKLDQ